MMKLWASPLFAPDCKVQFDLAACWNRDKLSEMIVSIAPHPHCTGPSRCVFLVYTVGYLLELHSYDLTHNTSARGTPFWDISRACRSDGYEFQSIDYLFDNTDEWTKEMEERTKHDMYHFYEERREDKSGPFNSNRQ